MAPEITPTSNLYDEFGEQLECCSTQFRSFGGRTTFSGPIVTLRAFEDNLRLKKLIAQPGEGRVLVIEAGGSLRVAMMGDNMAAKAAENGWAGALINGAVRDVAALRNIPMGVMALGSNPRRSRKEGVGQQDVLVSFGEAAFEPGRVLVADEDGVVVLPA